MDYDVLRCAVNGVTYTQVQDTHGTSFDADDVLKYSKLGYELRKIYTSDIHILKVSCVLMGAIRHLDSIINSQT